MRDYKRGESGCSAWLRGEKEKAEAEEVREAPCGAMVSGSASQIVLGQILIKTSEVGLQRSLPLSLFLRPSPSLPLFLFLSFPELHLLAMV